MGLENKVGVTIEKAKNGGGNNIMGVASKKYMKKYMTEDIMKLITIYLVLGCTICMENGYYFQYKVRKHLSLTFKRRKFKLCSYLTVKSKMGLEDKMGVATKPDGARKTCVKGKMGVMQKNRLA